MELSINYLFLSELHKNELIPITFGITEYYPVFCSRKPIIAGNKEK